MARHRKIPVRKHHGIRDPLKQKEKLEKSLKNVINNPPSQDDQKLTGRFARFKKLIDDTKAGKKFRKPQQREDRPTTPKNKKSNVMSISKKSRPIKQFANETDEDYLRRVNRITRESLKEAEFEIKYGVTVVRHPKTGAITVQKKPKNEIDELLKQNAKEKRSTKGGKQIKKEPPKKMDPQMAKEIIKQAIREDEEERQKEKAKELVEYKQDIIKFGEVVHAPPTISTLPRRAQKNETVPRPGKKNNLLLKDLLEGPNKNLKEKPATKAPKLRDTNALSKSQLKGKRKDLPAATRSMLENERIKMVEIYRQYKKSKEKAIK